MVQSVADDSLLALPVRNADALVDLVQTLQEAVPLVATVTDTEKEGV
jgi:hypothetical protein